MQVMVFEGTAYVTPLLGAYAADSFWGRYKTILVFSLIYCFVSAPLLEVAAADRQQTPALSRYMHSRHVRSNSSCHTRVAVRSYLT
jgi:hypothetical protein